MDLATRDMSVEESTRISHSNASNIARKMTPVYRETCVKDEDDIVINESFSLGGWLHGDRRTCFAMAQALRSVIIEVLLGANIPRSAFVEEVRVRQGEET